jgi:hypothetical protein
MTIWLDLVTSVMHLLLGVMFPRVGSPGVMQRLFCFFLIPSLLICLSPKSLTDKELLPSLVG